MDKDLLSVLKLPPVQIAPFFAAGVLLCANAQRQWLLVLAAVAAVIAVLLLYRKALVCVAALLAGMLSITCFTTLLCEPVLAADGTTQILTMRITDFQDHGGYSYYQCDTEINGRTSGLTFFSGDDFKIGDVITAEVSLTENKSPTAIARKLMLSGTVRNIISVESPKFDIMRSLAEYRTQLSDEISGFIDDDDTAALSKGMLFGDTSDFSSGLRHAAKVSGIMHFTAVSGSHFVIIMTVMLGLINEKRKKLRAVLSVFLIPLAVMFYGTDPSVLRAGIMLLLCNCGALFNRRAETLNSLCIAILIMTVFTPYVMLDVGFQMSVLGVFGVSVLGSRTIKVVSPYLCRAPRLLHSLANALIPSACAVICISPISADIFGGVSLVGAFTTLVLTPIFTLAMAFAIVFAFIGMTPALAALSLFMKACCEIIKLFGAQSKLWLVMDHEFAGMLALISLVALAAAVFFPKYVLKQGACVFTATIVAAFGLSFMSSSNRHRIEFVSNGTSGAAVVCEKNEAKILICGNGDDLDIQLADCLLQNGIYNISSISAPQGDYSGADAILRLRSIYPVNGVMANDEYFLQRLAVKSPDLSITKGNADVIEADRFTLSCAKAGDTECAADIVMYYSYKLSEPKYGAGLPLYVSSRQNILPENGINIFDTELEINLN